MKEDFTARLHGEIDAKVPIFGVSIDNPNDKATWKVQFVNAPTAEQEGIVKTIIDNFDTTDIPPITNEDILIFILENMQLDDAQLDANRAKLLDMLKGV